MQTPFGTVRNMWYTGIKLILLLQEGNDRLSIELVRNGRVKCIFYNAIVEQVIGAARNILHHMVLFSEHEGWVVVVVKLVKASHQRDLHLLQKLVHQFTLALVLRGDSRIKLFKFSDQSSMLHGGSVVVYREDSLCLFCHRGSVDDDEIRMEALSDKLATQVRASSDDDSRKEEGSFKEVICPRS